jgi:hypothetical protein
MDWVSPMKENRPRRYQVKSVAVSPTAEPDPEIGAGKVGLEMQFIWNRGERHILWLAGLEQLEKGAWRANWVQQPARHTALPLGDSRG